MSLTTLTVEELVQVSGGGLLGHDNGNNNNGIPQELIGNNNNGIPQLPIGGHHQHDEPDGHNNT